jgi:arsenate reductase
MREMNIKIGDQKPKQLMPEMLEGTDWAITMGCSINETCWASFVNAEYWDLDDPKDKLIREVRQIRDQIETEVAVLLKEPNNT